MKKSVFGIVLAVVLLLSVPLSSVPAAAQGKNTPAAKYSDVSSHWSKTAVEKLAGKNAIPFDEDLFCPNKSIKRGEFAVMLHNALGIQIEYFIKPDIKNYYDDIDENAAYASAVIDLVTVGVFEGKGKFQPEASLSREEMVHYIIQAYKYKLGDSYAMIKMGPAAFRDVDQIAPEYSGDVARAQHDGLIVGSGNNMFLPKKAASRAEAAVIISRLMDLLDTQSQKVTITPAAVVREDSIEMKITIRNNTKDDVLISHSSGQKFDFELIDKNENVIYRWSADKSFIAAMTTTKIEAGKALEFCDTLSGDAYLAIKDKIVYLKAYITGTTDFISSQGYEITVK